ncbi:MAG: hypothetical protein ACNI26_14895 [Terasakiella sp.]|uniref:hypothetical protein n=1 Tax=unclassified Terasakiella TaxID=2614952 RepID=UPI003B001987
MANELRKIGFSLEEVNAALVAYANRTGRIVPKLPIHSIAEEGGGRIVLYFGEDKSAHVGLPAREMITVLLVFCQDHKLPVPRSAKKALKLEGNILTLMIRSV